SRAADNSVVRVEHAREEFRIDVVEAGAVRRDEPFGNKGSQKQGGLTAGTLKSRFHGKRHTRNGNAIASLDFLEQLPEKHRHARDVDQAEHRMVVRALELVTLARRQPQRRVVTRVKESGGVN